LAPHGRAITGRVLVVDDEPANRKLLADLVVREGLQSVTAGGGAEALAILAREPIDLVLLDFMMPEVDGMAVLAELQRRQAFPALPVVVVTAHDDRRARIDALTAGAIDFLTKPIDRLEVARKVHTLIELKLLRERALAAVEGELRESDHLLRLRFEQSPVAKIAWDNSFRVVTWNPAAEKLFGYSRAEAIGRHAGFLLAESARSRVAAAIGEMRAGHPSAFTNDNITKAGETVVCEWYNVPLTSADGALLGVSSEVLDVTERVRLQAAVVQAQKMDAIGQLAGGIAHDFNNFVAVILAYAGFIRDALPEGDHRRDDVMEILKAADRAAGLTRQLLAFSRQQPTMKRPTDLNQSLANLHKLLARTVGEHIAFSVTPSARPAVVRIDPVQFDQVVLNLAVNARDAMPEGGRLRIALEPAAAPSPDDDGTGWVRLIVSDTGTGMDEQTQRRIFEPFFTTKERGKGTGLGLATCFGIVADADGTIRVQSAEGQGTTFIVEFPQCGEPADAMHHVQPVPRAGHGEHVLVAEDEPALRRVVARVLESAGYTVHVAADGREALQKLDELGLRLDLVFTDIAMPGCSGFEVVEHAACVAPGAAVLFTSGYLDEASRRKRREDQPMLWKPAAPRDVVRAVAQALSAGPRRETAPDLVPGLAPATRSAPSAPAVIADPAASGLQGGHPPRRERLLLVEDDEKQAEASKRTLGAEHFDVAVVDTLAGARRALDGGEFDALLLDVGLPDGSGLDLLRELRGHNAELPVVMMTGALSLEGVAQAIQGRVTAYLPKPFPADELLRVVHAAVESGRVSRLRTKLLAARFGGDDFVGDIPGTEKSFSRALPRIRMVYQPIVRAVDSSVFGYEALLRCDEPSLASPMRLLAAAEVLGRVVDVGRAVRASVAATMGEHRDRLEAIFINLHPLELRADLLGEAIDPLLPLAGRVVLEITERASIEAGPRLDDELARIRSLGYRLAVDDLGEGFAGLTSLVNLRPDIAKIDMSLVRDIHRAPLKRDIVAALVDMARRSRIAVVAEGVETTDERDTLVDLGCDLLQGYLFAKPGPPFPVVSSSILPRETPW
jgi:PAS domain S-box-containing protein